MQHSSSHKSAAPVLRAGTPALVIDLEGKDDVEMRGHRLTGGDRRREAPVGGSLQGDLIELGDAAALQNAHRETAIGTNLEAQQHLRA